MMSEAQPPQRIGRSVGAVLSGLNHLSLWRDRTIVIKYGGAATVEFESRNGRRVQIGTAGQSH